MGMVGVGKPGAVVGLRAAAVVAAVVKDGVVEVRAAAVAWHL